RASTKPCNSASTSAARGGPDRRGEAVGGVDPPGEGATGDDGPRETAGGGREGVTGEDGRGGTGGGACVGDRAGVPPNPPIRTTLKATRTASTTTAAPSPRLNRSRSRPPNTARQGGR